MTRKANFVPEGTADLFEPELSRALKGRVKRAADIVTPLRAENRSIMRSIGTRTRSTTTVTPVAIMAR